TINGTTRSATVTLQTGSNHILVEAFPNDSDCSLETVQLVLNYTPGGGQCTAPVDFITVTTPISGTILTTETVVLSGTVGANAATVTVNGVAMSLN
ncbi:MAG: hypothetical protein Q8O99_03945, partial [bacterium]|nr:hypothetical protein [bacterium]